MLRSLASVATYDGDFITRGGDEIITRHGDFYDVVISAFQQGTTSGARESIS